MITLILWIVLACLMAIIIVLSDKYDCSLGSAIAGALIAIFFEKAGKAAEDIRDTNNWKKSQTKLKRGGFINDDTVIRISFAYLYRIKIENKYLLVHNLRNTGKYQPVGGVYKFQEKEKQKLKNLYHVMDDDKILIDESSRNDYRLRMENRYLRKFVDRFNDKKAARERVDNVGREFKEELLKTGILNWDKISYRYCGRHMTELRFEEHFQIYEMMLFDIVELLPTRDQEKDLKYLMSRENDQYRFVTTDQINYLGIDLSTGKLNEWIGDHSKLTIQENESNLMKEPGVGNIYEVDLLI